MKILLGIIVGAALFLGANVYAQNSGIELVQLIEFNGNGSVNAELIRKYYDHDNGVVCYTNDGFRSGGISCLRN
jgi:hypothetical protein